MDEDEERSECSQYLKHQEMRLRIGILRTGILGSDHDELSLVTSNVWEFSRIPGLQPFDTDNGESRGRNRSRSQA
jgi:hypothetical protein